MNHKDHKHEQKHQTPPDSRNRPIHRDWRFLVGVGLMLVAMAIYVLSMDESLLPWGNPQPRVPVDVVP